MSVDRRSIAVAVLSLLLVASAPLPSDPQNAIQSAGKPYSVSDKRGTLRFEVRPGDRWKVDLKAVENKERAEVAFAPHYQNGQPFVVTFDMKIVSRKPSLAAWAVLGQINTTPPAGVPRTPPVSQQLAGNRLFVIAEAQAANGSMKKMRLAIDPSFARNKWHHFEWRVKAAPDSSGYLTILRDGQQVADYHGPLGYQTEGGLYFKAGIYRHASTDTLVVMYRRIQQQSALPVNSNG